MTLRGRVALVTGGAQRVGSAIALALAERGARVVITYHRSARSAADTRRRLRMLSPDSDALRADLRHPRQVRRLMSQVRARHGRLDVLVNSAANFHRTPFGALTDRDWDEALDTNARGPFLCALHASRLMARRGGKIINIADWAGERPYRDYLPYCVSKAAVIGLTRALAKELAPRIQVNAVSPGPVLPPEGMSRTQRARIARAVPLGRWGSPKDIAAAVVFLIEGTDFMTGSVVHVDGGRLIA
ncbi:MAG TPA: SDR family oxidoreductase [bacterium]